MKYNSLFLLVSCLSLSAFANDPSEIPNLNGSLTTGCNFSTLKYEGLVSISTMTFSNDDLIFEKRFYNDSLCTNEVKPKRETHSVKFKNVVDTGGVYGTSAFESKKYKFTVSGINEDGGEESFYMCFVHFNSDLLDKNEIFYFGATEEENGFCNIENEAWMR